MNRILLGAILFWGNIAVLTAQTITGTVFELQDQKKQPLTGANVYWEGTTIGTATDPQGRFEIQSDNHSHKLIISFIGYKPDTLIVKGKRSNLEAILSENSELDEVTVSSRRAGTHISRANPITTVTITGAELCKAACCNLAESFETNASVDVSYSDAATGARQIKLLGLSGTYIQMLTETMPNFRGLATSFGLDYVPGAWMESIQISKGAASVINGFEALTGQINIEYKKPLTSEKFFINGYTSSQGRVESNVNGSIYLGEKWKTAILAHASSDALENDDNSDGFLDEPLARKYSFMNRWEYNDQKQFNTQFGIKILEEERTGGQKGFDPDANHASPPLYGIFIDTKRVEGFFKAGYIFPGNEYTNIALVTNLSYHEQNSLLGRRTYNADQTGIWSNLTFQSRIGTGEKHQYTTGISYLMDQLSEDLSGPGLSVNYTGRDEHVPGLFLQYTYTLPDRLTLLGGLRMDHSSIFGTFFTPRLHLKYNLTEETTLRASAGKGYRTPNAIAENNSYLTTSRQFIVADNLRQEEGWNYGTNLTHYFHPGRKEVTLTLEFYRTDFTNQLVVDLDQSAREVHLYNLDGASRSNTFQAGLSSEIFKGLDLLLAWRLNDVQVTTNGVLQEKALQSRHKGLVNLSYSTPLKKWQLDFTTQLNGAGRLPTTAENPALLQRGERFSGYEVFNAQITKYFKSWNIYGGVENLSGFTQANPIIDAQSPFSDYFDSSMVWGPVVGRRFYFGFRFNLNRS